VSAAVGEASDTRTPVAVLGTGNIGSDLVLKLERSDALRVGAVVGIDPDSRGLAEARERGHLVSSEGVDFLLARPELAEIVFDATSAAAHRAHQPALERAGFATVDLTPAGLGPAIVPTVNLDVLATSTDVSLISCGAQATVPLVASVSRVAPVAYAEVVVTIASLSAGPGTRQNIDEFTQSTRRGLVQIGGAQEAKAIIILNPADPPITMRNTVMCELADEPPADLMASIEATVAEVQRYVPGYRLCIPPQLDGRVVKLVAEVDGAGDFLPRYAGNLDIITSAAVRIAELLADARREARSAAC
jgi:acetaldehyde dehydrogenase